MKDWFKKRLSEPSTYAGASALVLAGATLAKTPELVPVANSIGQNAHSLAAGDYGSFIAAILLSVVAIFKGDSKGAK